MLQVSSSSYSEYTDLLFFNLIASLHTLIIPYNNVVFRNITEIRKHRLVCDVSLFPYQFYISDISHNPLLLSLLWIMCCCLYCKGRILEQITTNCHNGSQQTRCCLYCKGRILEQITTRLRAYIRSQVLLLILQRKNFRANHNR